MPNDSYYRSNETAEALDGRRFTGEKRNKTAPTGDVVFPFQTNAEQRGPTTTGGTWPEIPARHARDKEGK